MAEQPGEEDGSWGSCLLVLGNPRGALGDRGAEVRMLPGDPHPGNLVLGICVVGGWGEGKGGPLEWGGCASIHLCTAVVTHQRGLQSLPGVLICI